MIEAVAVYSFRCQIYFKGIVFLLSIPINAVTEERVPLPSKSQLEMKDVQGKEDESWSSDDVRNLTPDIYSCIIRVSVAPSCVIHHES